jgi:hypothetical protein
LRDRDPRRGLLDQQNVDGKSLAGVTYPLHQSPL